ncbi:Mlo-related protein [Cynara cardunculus var. scolymus]|uniref:MLO-like protein n=1 Tax=Cynara cardunculus var. scolymus TaxID=59895 RepID=A0A103Y0D3_CYNCS|nr:Mlo-related protein [Cynara cardunculus var. scolymus]
MAEGSDGRTLEQTPTWAVATVCFVMIVISLFIEQIIHMIGHEEEEASADDGEGRRRLLTWSKMGDSARRILASSGGEDKCAEEGKVSFMSYDGVHQLHIFIFALALFHVIYCILTMALGQAKMKKWKHWEKETKTVEYQFSHDPERFRFARDTSFGRRHMNFWTKSPVLLWIVCFFRQFFRSVPKVDYLTLRHGFIMAHLAPQSQSGFDFQKYINRSLEEDFKVVVGISPPIWLFAIVFLLFNTHGWYSYLWLPFVPLIIILLIGTKLQVIITKMGLSIQQRGEVVQGVPVVQPGDDLFWFNRPRLILYLINFNAFQLAFFAWTWYEFGLKSCFHEHTEDIVIRVSMGVLVQFLCSYVTLPLYALVTQMGSTMKPTIFNERVATALKTWHRTAKKQIKRNKKSGQVTPMSSRPGTPSYGMSPVHLLRNYQNDIDSLQTSPRRSNFDTDNWDTDGSPSPSYHRRGDTETSTSHHQIQLGSMDHRNEIPEPNPLQVAIVPETVDNQQHEVTIAFPKEFSFDKRPNV